MAEEVAAPTDVEATCTKVEEAEAEEEEEEAAAAAASSTEAADMEEDDDLGEVEEELVFDDTGEDPALDAGVSPRPPLVRIVLPREPGSPVSPGAAAPETPPPAAGLRGLAVSGSGGRHAAASPAESSAESFFIGDEDDDSFDEEDQGPPAVPLDCPQAALMELLASNGFAVDSAAGVWRPDARQPRFTVRVMGHSEHRGHTRYSLDCELAPRHAGEVPVQWTAAKRLAHIRRYLHNPVKRGLGEKLYEARFRGTPFAKRSGPRGTTSRLDAWCASLASCVADATLPAALSARVLLFLEVPCEGHILALAGGPGSAVPESDPV